MVEIVFYGFAVWQTDSLQLARRVAPTPESVPNIQAIGDLLYTRYLFVFEGAGLVLLVAMIGAIVLTQRQRGGTDRKSVVQGKRVSVRVDLGGRRISKKKKK